ncbi:putative short-chain dehydrogenase [Diaporthe ampelina]|uniref:Putative short-chain dehydrogenase n=1 Tax=Diaporthe ampelina TaxID=1214573 RepID=A0A0G2H8Y5_9PEZI|nr:putative short-chain dehydrogenase [Diaporthe ampelina]
MLSWSSIYTQMWPPKPPFTEKDVPDLQGKVYIVTGSNTGVGKELAQILYSRNAKVYIAARSEEKANRAIADLRQAWPESTGDLVFLRLDLADLSQVKSAAEQFAAKETRLHVLFNNAAVQALGDGGGKTKTAQGHELHLGVNVLGVFLLTRLLTPALAATAAAPEEPPGSVRVVWVSSMGTEAVGEKGRGISQDYLAYWPSLMPLERYGVSKAGAWLHGAEFARRHRQDGIVSVPCNPGHLRSDLYRESGWLFKAAISPVLYPPIYGAYTELFCGLSPAITVEDSGKWVVPWGRIYPIRKDLQDATKTEAEGGNEHARKFWEWSEEQIRDYC